MVLLESVHASVCVVCPLHSSWKLTVTCRITDFKTEFVLMPPSCHLLCTLHFICCS